MVRATPEEISSRVMFVARLSNGDQDTMMSCRDVLTLLDDCDMLASQDAVRVRVGATPEPLTFDRWRNENYGPLCSSAELGMMHSAWNAALSGRAPEPLTACDQENARTAIAHAESAKTQTVLIKAKFLIRLCRAALRAPEPLTAELEFAAQVLEKEADDLHVCQFPKREAKFRRALAGVRAALEGGVSRTEPALTVLYAEVGRAMVEMTTTVRGPDEWGAIPELWRQCMEERDRLRALVSNQPYS